MYISTFRRICLLFLLFFPVVGEAQGAVDTYDVLSGFDEPPTVDRHQTQPAESVTGPLQVAGWFKLGSSWNFAHSSPAPGKPDWRGLSRLRSELLLETDLRLPGSWRLFASGKGMYDAAYRLNGRKQYPRQLLDRYEDELELRDTYLAGSLADHLDLKLGRQILVWGRSDNLRLTDVLNPLDLREPGLTDIEDLRLPVSMARVDAYHGSWNLSAALIPEIRFDKTPVFGHDFFPVATPLPPEQIPGDGLNNAEYALAVNGIFPGWDVSFYWADMYDDNSHFSADGADVVLKHSRVRMLGAAGNLTFGDILLFAEAARFSGLEFFAAPGRDFSRTDWLVGLEYSGLTDTLVSIEALNRHLHRYHALPVGTPETPQEDDFQWAFRLSRDFLHQKLTLTWLALVADTDGSGGSLQRYQGQYELAEALTLTGGVVLYRSGESNGFRDSGDNDRLFLELKYSF